MTMSILILTMLLFPFSANAEDGNFTLFKNASVINYVEDLSVFRINKATAEFYVEMKYKIPFDKFKSAFFDNLIISTNNNLKDSQMSLSNSNSSNFELTIQPLTADNDGEHTILFILKQKESDSLIASFKINTNGGDDEHFMEELGRRLSITGRKLAKNMKEIKKKANKN